MSCGALLAPAAVLHAGLMLLPDGKEKFPAPGVIPLETGVLEAAGGTELRDPDAALALGVLIPPPAKAPPFEELAPPNPVPPAGGTAPLAGTAAVGKDPAVVNKAMLERHLIRNRATHSSRPLSPSYGRRVTPSHAARRIAPPYQKIFRLMI